MRAACDLLRMPFSAEYAFRPPRANFKIELMTKNKALIVDDSKTAQHLLARMLQKYALDIDTALSAEEALLYLGTHHPSVIFLDQNMTGMNGIEALKMIRANPHTALVPVIMYTAQDDDLFVNEAIALGAQGIFSKSGMLPSNLQQVLRGLRIHPIDAEPVEEENIVRPRIEPVKIAPIVQAKDRSVSDLDRIRTQITRQFEIHSTDLGNQVNSAAQAIVKRLSSDISAAARREMQNIDSSSNLFLASVRAEVGDAVDARMRTARTASRMLFVCAMLAVAMTGYLAWWAYGELQQTVANLAATLESQTTALASAAKTVPAPSNPAGTASSPIANAALLRAVSWMQNANLEFDYGETPLNPDRVAQLSTLTQLLAEGGYTGQLKFDIHQGNFCMESDHANGWRLARSEMPATACKMVKEINPRALLADYVTVAYRNFEKTARPLQDGRIRIELLSSGLDSPRSEYPLIRASTTAGEWNRAALRNNRIGIRFSEQPEAFSH